MPSLSAAEAKMSPKAVVLRPEIEPLTRLLEDAPREKVLSEFAQRVKQGTPYADVLAALLLAGVRNVQPRPSVGFKFHAVLVVHSAHLASQSGPDEDRWLPIFWALDYFKSAQEQDRKEGDWTMAAVDESAVPKASQARRMFIEAMEQWDVSKADAAAAAVARTMGSAEAFDLFFKFGARDFRSIGHKAIFVANSRRALEVIGWQHAELVLRSLAYALLMHEGDNPSRRDDPVDAVGRVNWERAEKLPEDWADGRVDDPAALELLAVLRDGSADDAGSKTAEMLRKKVAPASLWEAVFNGAGESLLRQPGIVGLHTLTTVNALHQAYLHAGDASTRRFALLQAAAFLPMFHDSMRSRGKVGSQKIDALEAIEPSKDPAEDLQQAFVDLSRDRGKAVSRVLGLLQADPTLAGPLVDQARRLVFAKGRDSHDYKFSSAVLEDYHALRSPWRERFLAASMVQLRGAGDPDNPLVGRIRAAMG